MYTRRSLQPYLFLVVPAVLALGWAATAAATGDQKFPATGQTTCYDSTGVTEDIINCADTGQDGDIQPGATLKYKDQGNGTIRDRNTGLVWEKKSDEEEDNDGDNTTFPHDKDNVYTWGQRLRGACRHTEYHLRERRDGDLLGQCNLCGGRGGRQMRIRGQAGLARPQLQGADEHASQ